MIFNKSDASVPSGAILIWSGAVDAIPSGYALCDGTNDTPDLRDRFIIGAGSSYSVGATGGSTSHSHSMSCSYHTTNYYPENKAPYSIDIKSTDSATTLPPYYALCYIMKT